MDGTGGSFAELLQPDYWLKRQPALHIGDGSRVKNLDALSFPAEQNDALRQLVRHEGYFHAQGANWGVDLALMAKTVRALDADGISPVFAFVYDEFWIPLFKLHRIYQEILGADYQVLPDFWIWNVEPSRGDAGWTPHRDKDRNSLLPDGTPKSLSTWIPLTPATTLNGCMYCVPAHLDQTYNTPDEMKWTFELASVRALPGMPGDFFIWSQALLHWGSRTSPRAPESRISMAFETQRGDVPAMNLPLIPRLQLLDFPSRLKLICKQVLQYRHMYKVDPRFEALAQHVLG